MRDGRGRGRRRGPRDAEHLGLRAFALVAPLDGHRFRFVNRIPLERGLGSSAATIALGLVAGVARAGRDAPHDELLDARAPARRARRQPRRRRCAAASA